MTQNKKQTTALFIIAFLVILAVGFKQYRTKIFVPISAQNNNLRYEQLMTAEDRQPLPITPKARYIKVPILMYHHVGEFPQNATSVRKDLTVSPANFEAQIKWLSENNFTSISLSNLYLYSQGKFLLPKKSVIFTFDDGYSDVFKNAVPILKKYGFMGNFAIITQYPGITQGDNFYSSWPEIAAARDSGMEVVSHTQNHFDGKSSKFSSYYIFQNLSGSQKDIMNHLGLFTNVLIYPYGHYTSNYVRQAKAAGFVMGLTVHEGQMINLDNLMEIPRLRIHGAMTLEKFVKIISE